MNRETPLGTRFAVWKGIYLGGRRILNGAFLLFLDTRPIKSRLSPGLSHQKDIDLLIKEAGTPFVGKLLQVLTIGLVNGQSPAWACVKVFQWITNLDKTLRMPTFRPRTKIWIPLLKPNNVKVIRLLHVLPHPTKQGIVCHNLFIRKEIKGFE